MWIAFYVPLCEFLHEPINFLDDDNDDYDVNGHPFLNDGVPVPLPQIRSVTAGERDRANARRKAIADSMWEHYLHERDNID